MTSLLSYFQHLAQYNALANQILYTACARLDDVSRKQPRPAFFKSIHGTLNHILVGDRIWLSRFAGKVVAATDLDAILYDDFRELWQARRAEDELIQTFAASLSEATLNQSMRYLNNEGVESIQPISLLVAHFFNHQTHHRGQVHNLLCQTPVPPPSLDLHRILTANCLE
jgi:uncharacterized damage-inducible protein DinB